MSYYRTCPYCGANLDPGERCDCRDNEKAAADAANIDGGGDGQRMTVLCSIPILPKEQGGIKQDGKFNQPGRGVSHRGAGYFRDQGGRRMSKTEAVLSEINYILKRNADDAEFLRYMLSYALAFERTLTKSRVQAK